MCGCASACVPCWIPLAFMVQVFPPNFIKSFFGSVLFCPVTDLVLLCPVLYSLFLGGGVVWLGFVLFCAVAWFSCFGFQSYNISYTEFYIEQTFTLPSHRANLASLLQSWQVQSLQPLRRASWDAPAWLDLCCVPRTGRHGFQLCSSGGRKPASPS